MLAPQQELEFTNNWFEITAREVWDRCLPKFNIQTVLEIGSYEGRSVCYLIEHAVRPLQIHCIDTWQGSAEHQGTDMLAVEQRFHRNIRLAQERAGKYCGVTVHKGASSAVLPRLQHDFFDMIYIDGSHVAPDVLTDAVLSFPLLKSKGLMIFDDYLWGHELDILQAPKLGIDAFANVFRRQMRMLFLFNNQFWMCKE